MVSSHRPVGSRPALLWSALGLALVLAVIGFALLRFDRSLLDHLLTTPGPLQPAAPARREGTPPAGVERRAEASPVVPPSAPGAAPLGPILTASQARERVRQFVGDPNLPLVGLLESGAFGGRRYAVYHFETLAGPGEEVDEFKVDARTGEILEVWLRRDGPAGPPVDSAAAERIARDFAARAFAGFDRLRLVEQSTTPAPDEGTLYRFKWAQIAPSGAELPVSATVVVSGQRGRVVWYLAQRDPLEIDPTPAIPRERAVAVAAERAAREGHWKPVPQTVRLLVIYGDDNRQRLVWSVVFVPPEPAGRGPLRLLVDARSGELLEPTGPRG